MSHQITELRQEYTKKLQFQKLVRRITIAFLTQKKADWQAD